MRLKRSYRFWRGLVRAACPRMRTEWAQPFTGEPSVFICNHAGALGPIAMCARFPLADQLRRIAPAYRSKGIDITPMGHGRDGALWRISTQHPSTDATPPSVTHPSVGGIRYGAHRE